MDFFTESSDSSSPQAKEEFSDVKTNKVEVPSANIKELTQLTFEHKKTIDDVKKDIEYLKGREFRIIETLGIFVALFTFVSVDIQILRNIESLNNAVFFIILMFFCLIGFVFFLHIILNNKFTIFNFCILISLLFGIMIFFVWTEYNGKSLPLENTNTVNDLQKKIDGLEQRMNGFTENKIR